MAYAELMLAPLIIGLGHSVETDHLVAIGNLVDVRGRWWQEAGRGASWGVGHTVTVILAAACVGAIKSLFGTPNEWPFEILVGVMLVVIGTIRLYRYFNEGTNVHPHGSKAVFFRVGLVHGLAGSGSIAVLLSSHASQPSEQCAFLSLFGLGTVVGMTLVAALFTQMKLLNSRVLSFFSILVALLSLGYGFRILYSFIS